MITNNKKIKVKIILVGFITIFLLLILLFVSLPKSDDVSLANSYDDYVGESKYLDYQTIENAIAYEQGQGSSPFITVFTPGIDEDAFAWSSDIYKSGFSYNRDSLPEQIRVNYPNTEIYVAYGDDNIKQVQADTSSAIDIRDNIEFKLEKQTEEYYNNDKGKIENSISSLSMEELNNHIIIIYQPYKNDENFETTYYKLEVIINRLLYDTIHYGAVNPTVNLIGHGSGGLLNMKYANSYPNTVNSIYNIGTPHNGSNSIPFFDLITQSNNDLREQFDNFIGDIEKWNALEAEYTEIMARWNNYTIIENPNIIAHAIGGVTSADYFSELGNLIQSINTFLQIPADNLNFLDDILYNDEITDYIYNKKLLDIIKKLGESKYLYQAIEEDLLTDEELKYLYEIINFEESFNILSFEVEISLPIIFDALEALKPYYDEYLLDETTSGMSFSNFLTENYSEVPGIENMKNVYLVLYAFATFEEIAIYGKIRDNGTILDNSNSIENVFSYFPSVVNMFKIEEMLSLDKILGDELYNETMTDEEKEAQKEAKTNEMINNLAIIKGVLNTISFVLEYTPEAELISAVLLCNPFIMKLVSYLGSAYAIFDSSNDWVVTDFLSNIKRRSTTEFSDSFWDFLFFNDSTLFMSDLLVSYDSQMASGYNNFEHYAKIFSANDIFIDNTSKSNFIPIVHNLQTKDSHIINYVMDNIQIEEPTTIFNYKRVIGGYEITGFNNLYSGQTDIFLPQTYNDKNVVGIGEYAFMNELNDGHNIILPNTLEHISSYAFYNTNIGTINFPDNLVTIEEYAFAHSSFNCDINLPNTISEIETGVFADCENLETITFANNSILHTIKPYTFSNCYELSDINIPNSVTSICEYAFSNCYELSDINIPNGVTSINAYSFSNCTDLDDVDLPNSVTSIYEYAFNNCDSFTTSNLKNVKNISYGVFASCDNLVSFSKNADNNDIVIDNSKAIYKDNILYSYACGNLDSSYTILENTTQVGESAFKGAENLHNVTFPLSLSYIGHSAFESCTNITSIEIHQLCANIASFAFSDCSLSNVTLFSNGNIQFGVGGDGGAGGAGGTKWPTGNLASTGYTGNRGASGSRGQ